MATNVERYWEQFLNSIPSGKERPARYLESFAFGFTLADAKEIAQLVLAGTKIATGAVLWASQADRKPIPIAGDFSIVTVGGDDPVCIIETTDIQTIPFDGGLCMGWGRRGSHSGGLTRNVLEVHRAGMPTSCHGTKRKDAASDGTVPSRLRGAPW